jgi:hypothetical protein
MSRRLGLWITVLALPLAALGLLVAEPDIDLRWEHHPSHFWLVLTVAGVNVALGLFASEAAARRDDDRTFLVSMALLASAGFLGLHALATPGVLLDHTTAGFSVAARVGLLLAAGYEPSSPCCWPRGRSRRWPGSRCWTGRCHPIPCRHPLASWPWLVSLSTASPPFGTQSSTAGDAGRFPWLSWSRSSSWRRQ